jgi:hypothetical protein
MCFYERTDYCCGDWKWGNMKSRCARQHRLGESCGAKLTDVDNVKKVDQACRVCQTIGIAQRRLRYELGRIDRWRKEPLRFPCSLQKSSKTAWTLQQKIFDLQQTRVSVKLAHRKGIQAQSLGAGQAATLVFQQI